MASHHCTLQQAALPDTDSPRMSLSYNARDGLGDEITERPDH